MSGVNGYNKVYLGKTGYYNVYAYRDKDRDIRYQSRYKTMSKVFCNIKDAAKWVDMKLIEDNKEPKNILKRKYKLKDSIKEIK